MIGAVPRLAVRVRDVPLERLGVEGVHVLGVLQVAFIGGGALQGSGVRDQGSGVRV